MPIEIPPHLEYELTAIAEKRGVPLAKLVASALSEQMPALRASAERDVEPWFEPAPVPGRYELELAAIWYRLQQSDASQRLNLPSEQIPFALRVAREIPPQSFLSPQLLRLAFEIDDSRVRTFDEAPHGVRDALLDESAAWRSLTPEVIAQKMAVTRRLLDVTFRVHGRAPLSRSVSCTPFGGAEIVEVIAGPGIFGGSTTEIVGVRIALPIEEMSDRDPNDPSIRINEENDRWFLELPEFDRARLLLDHVLTLLRWHAVQVQYEDHRGDLGVPCRAEVLTHFGDGSTARRGCIQLHGWSSSWAHSPSIAATPFRINPALFKESFEEIGDELALLGRTSALDRVEGFRRAAMIVEAFFSGVRPALGLSKDEVDSDRKRRLSALVNSEEFTRRFAPFKSDTYPSAKRFAEDLIKLRDRASHLQKHYFGEDGSLEEKRRRYGLDIYDEDFLHGIRKVTPIAQAIALGLVRSKMPQLPTAPYYEYTLTASELLDLWEDESYCVDASARDALETMILARLRLGERDPRAERIVIARLASTDDLSEELASIASRYSGTTREALIASLRPNDLRSHAAVRELTRLQSEYPDEYSLLQTRLLQEPELAPLVELHDRTERENVGGHV